MNTNNGHKTIKVAEVVFRDDLYPRIETSAVTGEKYIEVRYRDIMSDVAPESLLDLIAGKIAKGAFYPYGSVASHFFQLHQENAKDIEKPPDVYFIRSQRGGPVKIGIACCVDSRVASLQTAHPYPLEVVATIPHGGRPKERELHKRFGNYRLNGEWFEWSAEMEEFINGIK